MPPFRMPFSSKRPTAVPEPTNDENARPTPNDANITSPYRDRPSLALGVKEKREEPNEFKLSSVNDSGEYLPPSPTEKKSFWAKAPTSASSNNHRICFNENEPFSISRESFESYRRSFDISGRSPILQADSFTSRNSLDSRPTSRYPTRSTLNSSTFESPTAEEEAFEDVKLTEEAKQQPKKKSFLSRFGDSSGETTTTVKEDGKHHFHILPGRKRGQSGTGSELGDMPRPQSTGKAEVAVR